MKSPQLHVCTPSPVVFLLSWHFFLSPCLQKLLRQRTRNCVACTINPLNRTDVLVCKRNNTHRWSRLSFTCRVDGGQFVSSSPRTASSGQILCSAAFVTPLTPPLATACNCTLKQTDSNAYPAAAEPLPTQTEKRSMCFDVQTAEPWAGGSNNSAMQVKKKKLWLYSLVWSAGS